MIRNSAWRRLAVLAAGAALAASAQAQFQEGTHYERIAGPEPEASGGTIEVVEAFGYPCPACRSFLPIIENWEENKPEYVEFRRLPVPLAQGWEVFARAFFIAQVMGIDEAAHAGLFQAMHDQGRQFRNLEDLAAFYADYGVDTEEFLKTAESFAVEARMRQNANELRRWGIRSTPTVIVNGKYRVNPRRGSTYQEMVEVIDYLVERERNRAEAASAGEAASGP